jgi:hypothetical protein
LIHHHLKMIQDYGKPSLVRLPNMEEHQEPLNKLQLLMVKLLPITLQPTQTENNHSSLNQLRPHQTVELLPSFQELQPMEEALHTLNCLLPAHHGSLHHILMRLHMVMLSFIHTSQPLMDLKP